MQNPKYVINLIDLQNIQTNTSGESSIQQLTSIVDYNSKTVYTDNLSNFSIGNSITFLSDINASNNTIYASNIIVTDSFEVIGDLVTSSNVTSTGTISASSFIVSNISLGVSSVYDTLYNPPVVAVSGSNTGGSVFSLGPFVAGSSNGSNFTVSQSGIYQIQTRLRVGGSAPTINTAGYIQGYIYDTIGSNNVPFSQQTISGSGIVGPDPSSDSIEYEYITNTNLLSNNAYRYTILTRNGAGGAGTWNLGTGSLLDVRLFRLS
jgi:hypothetical protein